VSPRRLRKIMRTMMHRRMGSRCGRGPSTLRAALEEPAQGATAGGWVPAGCRLPGHRDVRALANLLVGTTLDFGYASHNGSGGLLPDQAARARSAPPRR
jgi:hypothetical protein